MVGVGLEHALDQRRCVVCDSKLGAPDHPDIAEMTDERLRALKERYAAAVIAAWAERYMSPIG